ncbi:NADPH-dependent ferric siderophore reductase [Parafrankia colletiae]|uniref:NADPH-dependent ferric siderophore reductase n=1 Tax=Parafrankia colletiae TaxID=573497 RepID=A0A1S1Q1Q4_9ACTN|nr:siderophore-interacting protein [Parafrankia colletiae]MCK9903216.1 siderophore-interacting protein [Frankia sp. Cpl3]OHV27499.1 NADPH-dependent ferric siderophore reductase [Parafrankia colletiae]
MTDDSPVASPARPRRGPLALLDRLLLRTRVDSVDPLARSTRRIVLTGPALAGLTWTPGQNVTLFPRDPTLLGNWRQGLRDIKRSYSVWEYDPDGRLVLAVYDHGGDAPGAAWARGVAPGDEAIITKPDGHLVARTEAALHLFVGDDTAAVPFGAILRGLPASAQVRGVFECDSPADALPLPRAEHLTWTYRDGASAADSPLLPAALAGLDLPDPREPADTGAEGRPVAYVAGEARTCQSVRRHLVSERGWDRRQIVVQPFWTPGKRGMD